MNVFSACVSVHCMCAWCPGGQERASDLLEPESQMFISHQMSTWNLNQTAWKISKCS